MMNTEIFPLKCHLINGKKRPKAGINANFLYFLYVPSK